MIAYGGRVKFIHNKFDCVYFYRQKAFNPFHVMEICAGLFDDYFVNRLLNAALNKQKRICLLTTPIPSEAIEKYVPAFNSQEAGLFTVKSQSKPDTLYIVDINVGICQCYVGTSGRRRGGRRRFIAIYFLDC